MGKLRRLVPFARAGALAAGTTWLLAVWFQGMARLGFREDFPSGWAEILLVMGVALALASFLGFPEPPPGGRARAIRVLVTALFQIAIAAAVGGLGILASLAVRERNLPFFFAPVGAALVALGLRRLPRSTAARVALGLPAGLLLVTRLLAMWPGAAHAVTCRLYPLPPAVVRSELERVGWGQLSFDDRTKVIDLQTTPSYRTEGNYLVSDSSLKFTLEAVRPFYQDACGDLHTKPPFVAPFVHTYATREACEKEHPARHERITEMYHYTPSPCCVFELKQRQPGERFHANRTWEFLFKNRAWRFVH